MIVYDEKTPVFFHNKEGKLERGTVKGVSYLVELQNGKRTTISTKNAWTCISDLPENKKRYEGAGLPKKKPRGLMSYLRKAVEDYFNDPE